jgi:hypothetical protein
MKLSWLSSLIVVVGACCCRASATDASLILLREAKSPMHVSRVEGGDSVETRFGLFSSVSLGC